VGGGGERGGGKRKSNRLHKPFSITGGEKERGRGGGKGQPFVKHSSERHKGGGKRKKEELGGREKVGGRGRGDRLL